MTSLARRIPLAAAVLFFGVAALAAVLMGAGFWTAFYRGLIAGVVAALFSFFPAYLIFAEPLPMAKAPSGAEHLEEKFAPHPDAVKKKKDAPAKAETGDEEDHETAAKPLKLPKPAKPAPAPAAKR